MNDLQTEREPGIAALVGGIVSDAQDLIKQQFALLRSEVKQELRQARTAAISLGAGVGFLVAGGFVFLGMVIYLLAEYTPMPLWACYGIVAAVLLAVGGVLMFLGKQEADDVTLLPPPQSAEALKENMQWLQTPTNEK